MEINITKIVILLTNGMDKLVLITNLPTPLGAFSSVEPNMHMTIDAPYDEGLKYVKTHFKGVPREVKNVR